MEDHGSSCCASGESADGVTAPPALLPVRARRDHGSSCSASGESACGVGPRPQAGSHRLRPGCGSRAGGTEACGSGHAQAVCPAAVPWLWILSQL